MTSTLTRGQVFSKTRDSNPDTEFDGYYTIELVPIECPGCGRTMKYVEADNYHVIVVWEEQDDDNLLGTAAELKKQDLNPKVVEYESSFGRCIDYYVALTKGWIEG